MSTYARLWSAGALALTATGLAVGLVSHGLALMSIGFAVTGSLVAFVRWGRLDRPAPDLTSAVATGAIIGTGAVGSLGFGLWLGPPGFLLVLVMVVFSPQALGAITAHEMAHRTERRPAGVATSRAEEPAAIEPEAGWTSVLTNRELCDAWCTSYLALHAATSTEQRLRVVSIRKDYLDEIEARNPAAFHRWLASEPRASSSPARLLAELPTAPADDEEP